jgi:hypothetical protein
MDSRLGVQWGGKRSRESRLFSGFFLLGGPGHLHEHKKKGICIVQVYDLVDNAPA